MKNSPDPNASKASTISPNLSDTSICVRVRPLSEQELHADHVQGVFAQSQGRISMHEAKKKINGRPDVKTTSFNIDEAFGSERATQEIYDSQVQQLVEWAWNGGASTLLAYGQTGSGKTFTITGLEELVVQTLLGDLQPEKKEVHMSIFEIFGNNAYDLLSDRKQIAILEDSLGLMQVVGVEEKSPTGVDGLLALIQAAKALRVTAETEKNEQSSRSHAICRVRIVDKRKEGPEGTLFLVDLAGSEASADVRHHSAERTAESREINKSLTTLKECIRARASWAVSRGTVTQKHVHIPFRTSTLTKVLKPAFDIHSSKTCKTLVIACVSPCMLDVPHSRNTLRYAEMLKVQVPKTKPRPCNVQIPTTWSNKEVHEWIKKNSGKPAINPVWLAPWEDGAQLCRLEQDEFVARATRTPGVQQDQAKKLYFKLWTLHIDSRAPLRKEPVANAPGSKKREPLQTSEKGQNSTIQRDSSSKSNIKPGEFFRLPLKDADDRSELVMVMGRTKTMMDEDGNTEFICAELFLSNPAENCYELFVARQRTVSDAALCDCVSMEYDTDSRYYYLKE
ncbi:diatom spindle kinesin 1 [Penicillium riverlandense]|uniref:diatom spindle kinesin 1 n=1 Tax=Penicillium riverlandense TaxID=1903569 RepID=UPI0025472503|nr:diatom spindle kinesin 1 [Penicillium riverlandense]KAJ5819764.1 diatom spindle kinesin 1 [Penicillium riverlandense]